MLKDNKKIILMIVLFTILFSLNTFTYGQEELLAKDEEYNTDVSYMEKDMIVDKNITRSEFIKMVVNILELETKIGSREVNFKDVKDTNIYYPYIKIAYNADIIKGDGINFNPNGYITREEMATIISRSLKLDSKASDNIKLKDMDKVSKWAKDHVLKCVDSKLIIGNTEGYFMPSDYATKEMATVTTLRAYEKVNRNKVIKN